MDNNCTHNCATCGSSCAADPAENKDLFARMEKLVKELKEDDLQEMLAKIAEDMEKEG